MQASTTFLVERYIPRLQPADITALAARLDAAAADLRAQGREVRRLYSLAVLDDETCLCTFLAHRDTDVEEANRRACAAFERIVPVLVIENSSLAAGRRETPGGESSESHAAETEVSSTRRPSRQSSRLGRQ